MVLHPFTQMPEFYEQRKVQWNIILIMRLNNLKEEYIIHLYDEHCYQQGGGWIWEWGLHQENIPNREYTFT